MNRRFLPALSAAVLLLAAAVPALSFAQAIDSNARGLAVVALERPGVLNLKIDCGAKMDGVSDDTPAFATCFSKLAGAPGKIVVPPGIVSTNLVITQGGVTIEGSGMGLSSGKNPPTKNYWRAFDPTKPIIQIANDDGNQYSVIHISDLTLNCNGAGQYGLRFANGAYKNFVNNIQILGCTKRGLEFLGGVSNTSAAKNVVSNFHIAAYHAGAIALALDDPNSNANIFNNDHQILGGNITSSAGAISIYDDSSQAQLAGVKIDTGGQGGIVLIKSAINPQLYMSSVSIDSVASSQTLVVYKGFGDPTATTFYRNAMTGIVVVDGTSLAMTNQTTGTATGFSLVVADATGASPGKRVLVRNSTVYSATILAVSGNTLTLDTTAAGTGTAVEVDIGYDLQGSSGYNNGGGGLSAGTLNLRATYKKDYGFAALQPMMFGANALGSVTPYNTFGTVFEMGTRNLNVLTETQTAITPTSTVRVGATITVTTSAIHGLRKGDVVALRGANEAGINGTYNIVTVPTTTTFTVTSATSTPDLTATGTVQMWGARNFYIEAGSPTTDGSCYRMDTQYGKVCVLGSIGSAQKDMLLIPPGGAAGTGATLIGYGSGLEGTATEVLKVENANAFNTWAGMNGGGGWRFGTLANPFVKPSLRLEDAASDPSTNIGLDGIIYNNGGTLKFCTGSSPNVCSAVAFVRKGATASMGGSALATGACISTTVGMTGTTTAMTVMASPVTFPGDAFNWQAYVSTAGTVTVKVCATVAGTPVASVYNIRAIE